MVVIYTIRVFLVKYACINNNQSIVSVLDYYIGEPKHFQNGS